MFGKKSIHRPIVYNLFAKNATQYIDNLPRVQHADNLCAIGTFVLFFKLSVL